MSLRHDLDTIYVYNVEYKFFDPHVRNVEAVWHSLRAPFFELDEKPFYKTPRAIIARNTLQPPRNTCNSTKSNLLKQQNNRLSRRASIDSPFRIELGQSIERP